MVSKTFSGRVTGRLRTLPPLDIGTAIGLAVLTAGLNLLWLVYQTGYITGQWKLAELVYGFGHHDPSYLFMQNKIGVALLVIAAGLWCRNCTGFFISLLALTYVCGEYVWWYLDSLRWLREMGVDSFSQLPIPDEIPHAGNLRGATWWNVAVLVITFSLLVWEIRILAGILNLFRTNNLSMKRKS